MQHGQKEVFTLSQRLCSRGYIVGNAGGRAVGGGLTGSAGPQGAVQWQGAGPLSERLTDWMSSGSCEVVWGWGTEIAP